MTLELLAALGKGFLFAFVTVLPILNPAAAAPVFLSLTDGASAPTRALLARRIGQSLVRPDGVGLALCYSGLATPEKAFRRSHHLLARESEVARYEPRSMADERGDIRFHPPAVGNAARLPDVEGQLVCAMREGMLESVPMLFGLVPATVRETACAYKGDPHCTFELRWSRSPRRCSMAGITPSTSGWRWRRWRRGPSWPPPS